MKDDKTGGSETSDQALYAPAALKRDAESGADISRQTTDATSEPGEEHEEEQGPSISADMQRFIGRQLRAVYDDVAKQPVPDRFLELMRQLDRKTATG